MSTSILSTTALNSRPSKLSRLDWVCITACIAAVIYLVVREPILFCVLGCASIFCFSVWYIFLVIPLLERILGHRIQLWHVATMMITVTLLLSSFEQPAEAIFLSGLQNFFNRLATNSASNGAQAIPETTITLIFDLIRGVFLLLVAAAALFAYNQAQQGNDWRPIVAQVGIAFGVVLAIDVVTFLFVGNEGGGNAPQNQGAFIAPSHQVATAEQSYFRAIAAPSIDRPA
jgi:hypothetical protein